MERNQTDAREFVKSIDLSGTPRGILGQDAATEAGEVFETAKTQAQVVGSGLFSFVQGVTTEVRESISDSALLAQLVANKRHSVEKSPLEWYSAYAEVLQNVGWVMQAGSWSDYTASGKAMEVHEKIVEVLTVALGPSVAAMTVIKSAIDALKAMNSNSSWITIFSRESQKAKIARFQVGLVETGEHDDVFVSMLTCLIEAQKQITQVLFFKYKSEDASFKANSAKVSINRSSLIGLGPVIRGKVRAYQTDYLSSIQDL